MNLMATDIVQDLTKAGLQTMNPYVAAAKFVMEKNAPEKTIKKTADDISKDIIAHLKQHEAVASSN